MKAFSRLASPSGFALVLLLFLFLPFVSVSCDAGSTDYSGGNLAGGARPDIELAPGVGGTARDVAAVLGTDQAPAAGAQALALVVVLLLVAGIVLPFVPLLARQVRQRRLGRAAVAVLAGVLLVVTQNVAQTNVAASLADMARDLPGTGATPGEEDIADRFVHSGVGFWMSLVVLFVLAVVSVGLVYQDKLFPRPAHAGTATRSPVRTTAPIWQSESPEPAEPPAPVGPAAPSEPPAPVGPAAPGEPPAPTAPQEPAEPSAPKD